MWIRTYYPTKNLNINTLIMIMHVFTLVNFLLPGLYSEKILNRMSSVIIQSQTLGAIQTLAVEHQSCWLSNKMSNNSVVIRIISYLNRGDT